MIGQAHHVTDYRVITHEDAQILSEKVETAIHDGWQPFGSLCINPRGEGFGPGYAQAMVKYADRF